MGLKAVASSGTNLTPTFTSVTTPLVIGGTAVGSTLTLQSTTATGTTDKVLVKVGTNGGTTAGTFDHNGFNGTIGGTTAAAGSFTSVTSSALTAGRVPFAGTAGLLTDSSALTFSAGSLTATTFVGALTGNVTGNASTATALAAAAKYVSAAQTITAAGTLTLAHGLGASPTLIQARLICIDAGGDAGYSQNDQVDVSLTGGADAANSRGVSVVPDGTNLNVRFGSNANTFEILNKGSGGGTSITNSKWNIVFRAWNF